MHADQTCPGSLIYNTIINNQGNISSGVSEGEMEKLFLDSPIGLKPTLMTSYNIYLLSSIEFSPIRADNKRNPCPMSTIYFSIIHTQRKADI